MRSLLIIIGILLVVCAADVFGMGKSDGKKKDLEKPLKKEPVKVDPVPVKIEPVKIPAKIEPVKPVEKPDPDKVVLTVSGVPVKSGEVESRVDNMMKTQMSRMRPGAAANLPPDALKNMRERVRQNVVEGLIMEVLIDQKVKERKIEVTEAEVDDVLQDILTRNKMTEEQFKQQLVSMNVTLDVVRGQFKRQSGLEKLLELEMKAAGESLEVTDAEAKTFYDANQKQFGSPEQVRASHILIKADMKDETAKAEATKKIEGLLKRARSGEDFAVLAKQYTEDEGSKKTDGEYTFGRGKKVPPLDKAACSLEVGQMSDVVDTTYGYHIIKLSEKIPAKITSFEDAKADLLKNLGEQKKKVFWKTNLQKKYRSQAKMEWSPGEKERIDKASMPPAMPPSAPSRIPPSAK